MTGQRYTLVVHGGANTISKEKSTAGQQETYRSALRSALLAVRNCREDNLRLQGYAVLMKNGEAMDAATAAVCIPWKVM